MKMENGVFLLVENRERESLKSLRLFEKWRSKREELWLIFGGRRMKKFWELWEERGGRKWERKVAC